MRQNRLATVIADEYDEPVERLAAAIIARTFSDMKPSNAVYVPVGEAQRARQFLASEWFESLCDAVGLDVQHLRRLSQTTFDGQSD